jgi:hypothetical protein
MGFTSALEFIGSRFGDACSGDGPGFAGRIFVDGKPIKAICRELKISRKVVRKVLRSGETAFEYERSVQPLRHRHHQPGLRRVALSLRRRQDDHRAPRSAHPSLRYRRDRQRQLALQEPRLSLTARRSTRLRNPDQLRRVGSDTPLPQGSILDADPGSIFKAV